MIYSLNGEGCFYLNCYKQHTVFVMLVKNIYFNCIKINNQIHTVPYIWNEFRFICFNLDLCYNPLCVILQSLDGFHLAVTNCGKLLYISQNVIEYLGHSSVRVSCYNSCDFSIYLKAKIVSKT